MAETLRGRTPYSPEPGRIYELASPSGGMFRCEGLAHGCMFNAWFVNVRSGWYFLAHGVGIYPDGRIDWDYSTAGRFTTPPEWQALREKHVSVP